MNSYLIKGSNSQGHSQFQIIIEASSIEEAIKKLKRDYNESPLVVIEIGVM